jgi:hypothetical protein
MKESHPGPALLLRLRKIFSAQGIEGDDATRNLHQICHQYFHGKSIDGRIVFASDWNIPHASSMLVKLLRQ